MMRGPMMSPTVRRIPPIYSLSFILNVPAPKDGRGERRRRDEGGWKEGDRRKKEGDGERRGGEEGERKGREDERERK